MLQLLQILPILTFLRPLLHSILLYPYPTGILGGRIFNNLSWTPTGCWGRSAALGSTQKCTQTALEVGLTYSSSMGLVRSLRRVYTVRSWMIFAAILRIIYGVCSVRFFCGLLLLFHTLLFLNVVLLVINLWLCFLLIEG